MERAKRLEEIPLLKEQHEVLKLERKEVWEEQEQERILKEKEQREKDVENKKRMIRQGNFLFIQVFYQLIYEFIE